MIGCPDCANPDIQYRVGPWCAYHALVGGHGSPPQRQATAVTIDPEAFEKIAAAHAYHVQNPPAGGRLVGRKFGPWEERAIVAAYAAADRIITLYGWAKGS